METKEIKQFAEELVNSLKTKLQEIWINNLKLPIEVQTRMMAQMDLMLDLYFGLCEKCGDDYPIQELKQIMVENGIELQLCPQCRIPIKYDVEDWIEFNRFIGHEEISETLNLEASKILRKNSNFIKSVIGIETYPILVMSEISAKYYVTNIYKKLRKPNGQDLIVAYSKREATPEEIEKQYSRELKE